MGILKEIKTVGPAAVVGAIEPITKMKSIPALTGLRAIACLLVVVSHLPIPGLRGAFFVFEKSGYSGVTFFYILSGFVLAYNYLDTFRSLQFLSVWNFLVSRVARVYPVYICVILAVSWWRGFGSPSLVYVFALQAWSKDVYVAYGIDGPSWSISVEMFLYAMFPILLWMVHRSGIFSSLRKVAITAAVVCGLMLAIALIFTVLPAVPFDYANSSHRWLYRSPLNRLGDFSLGILGAVVLLRFPDAIQRRVRLWRLVRYFSFGAIVWMMTHRTVPYIAFRWDVAYAIPFALVILSLSASDSSLTVRFLRTRFMVVAGEVSFAFYLIHVPASEMWNRVDLGTGGASYVAKIIFITLLASGIHFILEKPVQGIVKKALSIKRTRAEVTAELVALKS